MDGLVQYVDAKMQPAIVPKIKNAKISEMKLIVVATMDFENYRMGAALVITPF